MALRFRGLAVAAALALGAGACGLFGSGSGAEKPAAPIEVAVVAAPRLNPDGQGQSLPTVVRLYQLKSAGKLENAEFDVLYRQPKEALGEDLLAVEEITLSPGETVQRRLERDRSAKVLAAVALFRRPAASSWRAIAPLPQPADRAQLRFAVEDYRIERR